MDGFRAGQNYSYRGCNDRGDAMQFGGEVVKLTFKNAKITIDRVVLKSKEK